MGMYTECYINCRLIRDLPKEVIDILKYLFDNDDDKLEEPAILPEHKFFKTTRWEAVGHGHSFYHIPFPTSKLLFMEADKRYYLTSRFDLKNYEGEIELLFDWIMPYMDNYDGEFIGYSRYEEDNEPVLIFARKNTSDC